MAVAALVLGLVGVLVSWVTFLVPSILAIVFGIVALRQTQPAGQSGPPPPAGRGMAIAGILLGGLTSLVVTILWLVVWGSFGTAADKADQAASSSDPGPSLTLPSETADGRQETTSPPSETRAAGIGAPVRDGKFEFTVSKVRCGVPSVGGEYGQKADGQFCLVSLKVENIGDESQLLNASSQYAYDATGRKLDADAAAGIYANPGSGGAFLNEINPGNAAVAILVFDIPRTAKLVRLELHDSPFSGGVEVRVD